MLNKVKYADRGNITIEATISLSMFMFAIVTILTIVNICVVQAKIAYAINTTAREISQYSYLYSLTGINESQQQLANAANEETADAEELLRNVNSVYNEIQNLGNTGKQSVDNIDDIFDTWETLTDGSGKITASASEIRSSVENIAKDPKSLLLGIAKLASTEGFNLATSKLIAEPLSREFCKKHLVNTKGGDVEEFLKYLSVVPSANGSYFDGLDFSNSTFFPYGSSEIKINVSYDVKIIPLLPLDFTFHFNQTAITHGWLAGSDSYKSAKSYTETETLWTQTTVNERANLIRHLEIEELKKEGYQQTSGLDGTHAYQPDSKEFVKITSMNPLYSANVSNPKTLEDIDEVSVQTAIEKLCKSAKAETKGLTEVTTKTEKDGIVKKQTYDCTGSSNKVVIVVPEDAGLQEKIQEVVNKAEKNGVEVQVVAGFGNGSSSTVKEGDEN